MLQQLRDFASLIIDRRVPLVSKVLFVGLVGGYLLFPLDFVPDFLPVVGIADDGAALLTAFALFSRYARKHIDEEVEPNNDGDKQP